MNAREVYNAIQAGDHNATQSVLTELLSKVEVLATATLEIAGERVLSTGTDPLSYRSRLILSEFIELPVEGSEVVNSKR